MSIIPSFYGLERPFHLMERELFRPNFPPFGMVPREFYNFRPWENSFQMERLSDAIKHLALQDMGTQITADDEKFQVNIDVQHFSPNEISVKVVDGSVVVEGKHLEKQDEHGFVSRRFVRRYALPKGCLPDTVESQLSSDGILTVTAPKVLPLPSMGEKIIPIMKTGPVQKQFPEGLKEIK